MASLSRTAKTSIIPSPTACTAGLGRLDFQYPHHAPFQRSADRSDQRVLPLPLTAGQRAPPAMCRSGAASCNCVVTVYQPAAPDDLRNTTVAFRYAARRPRSAEDVPVEGMPPRRRILRLAQRRSLRAGQPPLAGGPSSTDGDRRTTGTTPAATATRCSPPDSVQACARPAFGVRAATQRRTHIKHERGFAPGTHTASNQ
jgi:hypothetical protein